MIGANTELTVQEFFDDAGNSVCSQCKKAHNMSDMLLMRMPDSDEEKHSRVCATCSIEMAETRGVFNTHELRFVRISMRKLREYEANQNLLKYILEHKEVPEGAYHEDTV